MKRHGNSSSWKCQDPVSASTISSYLSTQQLSAGSWILNLKREVKLNPGVCSGQRCGCGVERGQGWGAGFPSPASSPVLGSSPGVSSTPACDTTVLNPFVKRGVHPSSPSPQPLLLLLECSFQIYCAKKGIIK